jgi:molecular chaperone DnaK
MGEYGDKIPAEKKEPINAALVELKEAHKNQDLDAVDAATTKLNAAWQAASEEMYKAAENQGPEASPQGEQNQANAQDEVTDVDFEEVKDK